MNPIPPEMQRGPFETPETREAMQGPWQRGEAFRDQAQHARDYLQQQLPPGASVPPQFRDFNTYVQQARQDQQRQMKVPGQRKSPEVQKPPETVMDHILATAKQGFDALQNAKSPEEAFMILFQTLAKIGELFGAASTNGKFDWKKLNSKYVPASAKAERPAERPDEIGRKHRENITEIERQLAENKKKSEDVDKQITAINANAGLKEEDKVTQRKSVVEQKKKLEEERKNLVLKHAALKGDDVQKKLRELATVIAERTNIAVRFNITSDPVSVEVDIARVPDADREALRQRLLAGGDGVQGLGFKESDDKKMPYTYVWQVKS